jgi:hypothetical protein
MYDKVTIVAYHNKDLKPKTSESIERQAEAARVNFSQTLQEALKEKLAL